MALVFLPIDLERRPNFLPFRPLVFSFHIQEKLEWVDIVPFSRL
jgi:hypothetical protein